MLKWVVTQRPVVACGNKPTSAEQSWSCNEENCHPQELCFIGNNDTNAKCCTTSRPTAANVSSLLRVGNQRSFEEDHRTSPISHSRIVTNNTLTSLRYFLLNDNSSPLKRANTPVECRVRLCTTSPLTSRGCYPSTRFPPISHKTIHQRARKRLSSLHIREPTELASPSYRSADDPATDLFNESTGLRSVCTDDSIRRDLCLTFPVESEPYNEREVKTPESEKQRSNKDREDWLIRRKAVRRRKYARHKQSNNTS